MKLQPEVIADWIVTAMLAAEIAEEAASLKATAANDETAFQHTGAETRTGQGGQAHG